MTHIENAIIINPSTGQIRFGKGIDEKLLAQSLSDHNLTHLMIKYQADEKNQITAITFANISPQTPDWESITDMVVELRESLYPSPEPKRKIMPGEGAERVLMDLEELYPRQSAPPGVTRH